ncbi:MAG: thioredoxin family protein [Verrucomicrobiota bacterium]|nr:thioredoxin family protein [Verrucomicrobiota bacterium]
MKRMASVVGIMVVVAILVISQLRGRDAEGHEGFDTAMARAKAGEKCLFLSFTGSDWCGWCIKLDQEVFSQQAFKDFARDHLVLVTADFPSDKSKQSADLQRQNKQLAEKFGVRGFPSVFILGPDGNTIVKTGYQAGGAEAYVKHIKKLIAEAK